MILSQIAAISSDFSIGKDNDIIWRYPEDLKYFKSMTLNKIIITGRKNFDSIVKPKGQPLPHRYHIVISRSAPTTQYDNVVFVNDIPSAYKIAQELVDKKLYPEEVFIIGGAEIYKQTLPDSDNLYITRVNKTAEGDTFYPDNFPQHFQRASARQSELHPELTFEVWHKANAHKPNKTTASKLTIPE